MLKIGMLVVIGISSFIITEVDAEGFAIGTDCDGEDRQIEFKDCDAIFDAIA